MIKIFNDISHACSELTTLRYSTSFSNAIKTLHKDLREPIFDIYSFVRFADEIVDTFHEHDKAQLLAEFKAETYNAVNRRISLNPILHSFQITVNKFNIDHALIDAFFASMEMDLDRKGYDRTGYEEYIYGSAEAVGLMCLAVFLKGDRGEYERLRKPARALGSAFQKINFLRDLKADHHELNRVYFPGVDFANFQSADKKAIEADIEADLSAARTGIPQLPAKARFGVYLAYKYYLSLFNKIKREPPQQLLKSRVRIPDGVKILIFAKAKLRNSLNLF